MNRVALVLGAAIVIGAAVLTYNALSTAGSAPTLAPATVPSEDPVCSQPLHHSIDGAFSPLFCSGGEINKDAWTYIAGDGPQVMKLGRDVGPRDVAAAIESDLRDAESGRRECSAALLAAAYYGWKFQIPAVAGMPIDCAIIQ